MKRLRYIKKGIIDWEEVENPRIKADNQVILKPVAIARCDLDLPIVNGQTLFRPSFPIGHEFVGIVEEVSNDLKAVYKPGARYAVSYQISCGSCPNCENHNSKSCLNTPPVSDYGMGIGANIFGGALAEKVLVPYAKQMLLTVKDNIDSVAIASLSDNISEAWKLAGKFLEKRKDMNVLVIGGLSSSIGLYTALLANVYGSGQVTYVDTDRERVDMAIKLGIKSELLTSFPKSFGKYDLVCECSVVKEGWDMATKSLSSNGILSSASIFWSNRWEIPYLEMYNGGVEMHIERITSREYMEKILALIESGLYDPGPIVTSVASFSDAKEAWMSPSIKLVITNE